MQENDEIKKTLRDRNNKTKIFIHQNGLTLKKYFRDFDEKEMERRRKFLFNTLLFSRVSSNRTFNNKERHCKIKLLNCRRKVCA